MPYDPLIVQEIIRLFPDILQMAEANHITDCCDCEEEVLEPARKILERIRSGEKI